MTRRSAMRTITMLPVRWSGLAMAAGLAAAGHGVEAAVAMLVALAQVLGWRLRLPTPWEIALSATCLIAAVSSYADLYARIAWWDLPVHAALTGQLAVLGAVATGRRRSPRAVIALGAVLALVWEALERWGHVHVDATIHVSAPDTALDVAAGVLGSVLAAIPWARTGAAGGPRPGGPAPRPGRPRCTVR